MYMSSQPSELEQENLLQGLRCHMEAPAHMAKLLELPIPIPQQRPQNVLKLSDLLQEGPTQPVQCTGQAMGVWTVTPTRAALNPMDEMNPSVNTGAAIIQPTIMPAVPAGIPIAIAAQMPTGMPTPVGIPTGMAVMTRVIWALGKLGAKGRDVEGIIQTFAQRAPPVVPRFSPQESWRGALGEAAEAVKRESDQAMCFRHDWPFHHRSQHGVWCLGHQHRSRHVFSASFCVALSRCPVGRGARGALVTSEELSNMLWGLARLTEQMKRPLKEASQLAQAVMKESTARLSSFSTQCLTNSLWAVAKLGLRGPHVPVFTKACVSQIHCVMFKEMSPQGLANSVWALAKIQSDGPRDAPIVDWDIVAAFSLDASRRAMATEGLLKIFFPQELSMALWGIAKLRRKTSYADLQEEADIDKFALAVAVEASERIDHFSAQGVSVVAWSLATMNLLDGEEVVQFFEAAAQVASEHIQQYPPQAIANLCWSLGRLTSRPDLVASFGRAAAREAMVRMNDFSWQDLSGIVSSLMNLGRTTPEVQELARKLCQEAAYSQGGLALRSIGTQAVLNIALSAVRLKLEVPVLTPLAEGIAQIFSERRLNDIDLRQWQEVQRYIGEEFEMILSDPMAKFIDYGNAVFEGAPKPHPIHTKQFRAPEVLLKVHGGWGPASDTWTLGVTGCFLVSGQLIFNSHDPQDRCRSAATPSRSGGELLRLMGQACGAFPPRLLLAAEDARMRRCAENIQAPRQPQLASWLNLDRKGPAEAACADLLLNMLALDPSERISASDALCHPFLAENGEGAKVPVPPQGQLPLRRL
eukprot:g17327.t1